ncbi:hypothetical protein [Deinococcus multiflagellatus]|uniref:Uncharacterized protein n=1 Tax=Deinococcus multiflagellatus TaxID=1656887 RepID=A0ABW1ZQ52_9DEIO
MSHHVRFAGGVGSDTSTGNGEVILLLKAFNSAWLMLRKPEMGGFARGTLYFPGHIPPGFQDAHRSLSVRHADTVSAGGFKRIAHRIMEPGAQRQMTV